MRNQLLKVEGALLAFPPVKISVRLLVWLTYRAGWLWGRVRFGVLVPNKGDGCVCHWNAELKYPENIILGEKVVIGANVTLGAHSKITLGDNVRLSKDVIVESAGLNWKTQKPPYEHQSRYIFIQDGVWIGARAIVLGGVTIGENSVIAAGSVVTQSIPKNVIAAGVPAKVVKSVIESG